MDRFTSLLCLVDFHIFTTLPHLHMLKISLFSHTPCRGRKYDSGTSKPPLDLPEREIQSWGIYAYREQVNFNSYTYTSSPGRTRYHQIYLRGKSKDVTALIVLTLSQLHFPYPNPPTTTTPLLQHNFYSTITKGQAIFKLGTSKAFIIYSSGVSC